MASVDAVVAVLIDDADFERVAQIGWFINENGYARGHDPESDSLVYMHRYLLGLGNDDPRIIDHINRCTWDNRRANLRVVRRSVNSMNSTAEKRKQVHSKILQSKFKGVHWLAERSKWSSQFRGKYLGVFVNEIDAARAYNNAAMASGIEGVWLNDLPEGKPPAPSKYARGSSMMRGVKWNGQREKWHTEVHSNGVRIHAGFYADERAAGLMRDAVVRAVGFDLPLNFPEESMELTDKMRRSLRRKGFVCPQ
jgi:hypothetical protein